MISAVGACTNLGAGKPRWAALFSTKSFSLAAAALSSSVMMVAVATGMLDELCLAGAATS
jgi:hypothetical protein